MFKFLVVGIGRDGQILETWRLRRGHNIDLARMDMYCDAAIKQVVVVSLCQACGCQRVRGVCQNERCKSHRRAALPVPEEVTVG